MTMTFQRLHYCLLLVFLLVAAEWSVVVNGQQHLRHEQQPRGSLPIDESEDGAQQHRRLQMFMRPNRIGGGGMRVMRKRVVMMMRFGMRVMGKDDKKKSGMKKGSPPTLKQVRAGGGTIYKGLIEEFAGCRDYEDVFEDYRIDPMTDDQCRPGRPARPARPVRPVRPGSPNNPNANANAGRTKNLCNAGCCRIYSYLVCDTDNSFSHLQCVCNARTYRNNAGGVVNVTAGSDGQQDDDTTDDGDGVL